ncbi:FAD-binding oxidoreductase [Terrabacter sp. MAHUQ-38]|uniref:NAD(P)/FAD-dependent oxidoreductase n=1 Tax=unclassified Terrabacter TaxID=2630222 RepID=UPI00165E81AC|nr:FAD-binding oxidoreductase [Terrabacter sp. MAHUQ-38]MBC9822185.1 FAD-binding oxidoreductase [Terrabacter sp. MAHUQ-38]
MAQRPEFPSHASVVIIGGGVMGVSTAYHLARAGVTDVVLVEKDELGSGSTCKAAGGVRAQFSDRVNIELGLRSLRTFETFRETFGQEIDLHQVGYLFLLDQPDHVAAFERNVALQNELGVPSRMIEVDEAKALSPLVSTEGLLAASWSPTDGHCTPESVVLGYAGAARRAGAHLLRGCTVSDIASTGGAVTAVVTDRGTIATDTVICTAGAWSRAVGDMVGVDLPVEPMRRQILTTEPMPGLDPRTPFTIDFSTSLYFHCEGPGLLLGMSDPDETPGFKLKRSDGWLPRLADAIEHRVPALAETGLGAGWAGLYEMTPDHNALVGEAREVSRFLYATGFSGHGFLMGPAIGEVMRDLYLGRPPVVDISSLHAERFAASETRPELNIV